MDEKLYVGFGYVTLRLRHARTLKDRRNVLASLTQKLRNLGFSAVEKSGDEDKKSAILGFSYIGTRVSQVEKCLDEAFRLFQGDYQLTESGREIMDYDLEPPLEQYILADDED